MITGVLGRIGSRMIALAIVGALVGACSGSSATPAPTPSPAAASGPPSAPASVAAASATPGAPLVFGDLAPFTGPDAFLGPRYLAGCYAAASNINSAGGVLGHPVNCQSFDTRGDPADAVPAAQQMLATNPNLALVFGVTSDEASSVVPILNRAPMVMFSVSGQAEFDKSTFQYYYRLIAADDLTGVAVAIIAHNLGYKNVALVFGNDIGSQGTVPTVTKAFQKLGGTIAINQAIALDQSSYRTEITQLLATHPDAIITETDGQTAGTYLSELKQLNNGKLLPIVGTDATVDPLWWKAASGPVGAADLAAAYSADNPSVILSGAPYDPFAAGINASTAQMSNITQYLTVPYTMHIYDSVTIGALAMVAANSTSPATYQPFIAKVCTASPGATVVHSFADGVKALQAGQTIDFVGPGDQTVLNQWHNSPGGFSIVKYGTDGSIKTTGSISAADMQAAAP
ncbi:MAG: ABC transporter substrate-binding protein [Candidatus Limnocylindrales bacterium]